MEKIKLSKDLRISRLVHGQWRIVDWKMSTQEILKLTDQVIELGITTFDNADIYGDYSCEELFGNVLRLKKELRHEIEIITKCGIKIISDKYPSRITPHYDYSYDHIISSVETSLKKLNTDHIDLLLLHRPAPFFNPTEVAKAFSDLKKSGKVLHFGVSNFDPMQFEMLNAYTDEKLVTNQVEISPYCLEHFENGNIDFFLKERIIPMAWSPLAGGSFVNPQSEKELRVSNALKEVAEELNIDSIDKIIYSWLLKHPASIIPVIGTGKIERIKNAVDALGISLNLEQWYKIFIASRGEPLP